MTEPRELHFLELSVLGEPSVLMLAFYKGRARFLDRLIQWWTASRFSHVEMFEAPGTPKEAEARARLFNNRGLRMALSPVCISASWRDGGVRAVAIDLDPARWELVAAPWADAARAVGAARRQIGKPYDLPGLVRTQILRIDRERDFKAAWFCSELVGFATMISSRFWMHSPGSLHQQALQRTLDYWVARG